MSDQLHQLRDELNLRLRGVEGVISVGIGKKDGRATLIVAIDRDRLKVDLPKSFDGVAVVQRDFGSASLHAM